jgi:hypothetical protein
MKLKVISPLSFPIVFNAVHRHALQQGTILTVLSLNYVLFSIMLEHKFSNLYDNAVGSVVSTPKC